MEGRLLDLEGEIAGLKKHCSKASIAQILMITALDAYCRAPWLATSCMLWVTA